VLGSIERLKRKWFCSAEKFRVFQQYRPVAEGKEYFLSVGSWPILLKNPKIFLAANLFAM
jgi:hypothetical protein